MSNCRKGSFHRILLSLAGLWLLSGHSHAFSPVKHNTAALGSSSVQRIPENLPKTLISASTRCRTTRIDDSSKITSARSVCLSASTLPVSSSTGKKQKKPYKKNNNNRLEREIVRLGRNGNTREALDIYKSIQRPTLRQINGAMDACARARPTLLEKAFDILDEGIRKHRLQPNVFTFGALTSACARARRADKALQVLRNMEKDYNVKPNAVVYSTAISACARSNPPKYETALELLEEATQIKNLQMSVVGYNAALSACAGAGKWQRAIQLLETMKRSPTEIDTDAESGLPPAPDAVTYGTILAACEKAQQWELVLKYAREMQQSPLNLPLDGMSATSALHACQQLGLPNEALSYLEQMKSSSQQQERKTSGWQRRGARAPLMGPDAVAYRLAISACARGGAWEKGIELLGELRELTKQAPDVVAYTSAITGCEYAGEWKRAFSLLEQMRKDGVAPNEVTMAAILGACATASANYAKHVEPAQALIDFPKKKALQLLNVMKKDASVVDPNIVVYNAAIRACAEAMDLQGALKLLEDAELRGLEPTVVTYGTLMTACERVGDVVGASKVFKKMKAAGIEPNEIIYGAAISCCRKAGDGERALLLLRKMIREELAPNAATFNTVIVALTEGRKTDALLEKAMLVYKLMKSRYAPPSGRPNRQTYNLLIRALAANRQPLFAEGLLEKMREEGLVPDVDLYTATVTAYEQNRQPLKALRLMESMQQVGYDFYDIKVLDEAFKKAVKLVSVVGRGLGSEQENTTTGGVDFIMDSTNDGDAFIKDKRIL